MTADEHRELVALVAYGREHDRNAAIRQLSRELARLRVVEAAANDLAATVTAIARSATIDEGVVRR